MLQESLDRLAATLKTPLESKKLQIGKYSINYVTAGRGFPILLIHGANIGWPQWYLNLDSLDQKHKIIAVDLPGAGGSSKVNFRKTDFEDDYVDIVDQLVKKLGLSKVDIIGSSFGGWIAMKLAIAGRPYMRKLILANPIGFTRHMPLQFRPVSVWPLAVIMSKTALKPVRSNKNLEKFMRDVFHNKELPLKTEFIDYFYELSKTSHNLLFISKLSAMTGMRKQLFLADQLGKISNQTLVIWGKQDPLMPYKTVRDNLELIPNVKVEVLDDIGHMPPVESPQRFNELVLEFLRDE